MNYVKKIYAKQGYILDFDASIFWTKFSNKIVPNYDINPNLIIYDNLNGRSITKGASINFNSLFNNVKIIGGKWKTHQLLKMEKSTLHT